jgi:hypothetical protein
MIYLLTLGLLDNDNQAGSAASNSAVGTSEDSFGSWGSSSDSNKEPPILRKPPPPSVSNQQMKKIEELVARRNNLVGKLNRWYNTELATVNRLGNENLKELERREKKAAIANDAVNDYRARVGLEPILTHSWKTLTAENDKNNKEKKS